MLTSFASSILTKAELMSTSSSRSLVSGGYFIVQYVLARVFGTSGALFDRSEEQAIFAAVAQAGLGPKLLVRFNNLESLTGSL